MSCDNTLYATFLNVLLAGYMAFGLGGSYVYFFGITAHRMRYTIIQGLGKLFVMILYPSHTPMPKHFNFNSLSRRFCRIGVT